MTSTKGESNYGKYNAGNRAAGSSAPLGGPEKAVPGELRYHSRNEPPEPREQKRGFRNRGGVFKSNPTLLLIVIDIFVIILVLVFLLPFLRPGASEDDFFGFSFSLHGYLYRNTAHMSVIIQPADPRVDQAYHVL